MSLNFVPVVDPNVAVDDPNNYIYGVLCSGTLSDYQETVSNNLNNGNITIQVTPPSMQTFVDKRMYLSMGFDITLVGQSLGAGIPLVQAKGMNTAPGISPGLANFDAPRAFPISQVLNTLGTVINGVTVSNNLNTFSRILSYFYRNKEESDTDYSLTPSMRDQSQNYSDLDFTNRSPLNPPSTNTAQDPRGGFVGCTILRNDSTGLPGDTAIIRMFCTEPFWLSPWNSSKRTQQSTALIGIKQIQCNFTFGFRGNGNLASLASSLWSHSTNGSVLTSCSANIIRCSVLNRYITPDLSGPEPIPNATINSYYTALLYPTTNNSNPVPPGGMVTLQMNNVQLTAISNKLYLWVDRRDQDCNITTTDCFPFVMVDNGLTVNFNNQPGILSGATRQDLYNIFLKHGGNMSWREWTQDAGSILPLAFGDDISLRETLAPGVSGNFNLQIKLTVQNASSAPVVPQFNVLIVDEGTFTIINGQVLANTNVLTQNDVFYAKDKAPVPFKPARNFYGAGSGSGFFDDLGNFFKKIFRPGLDAAKLVSTAVAPQFLPALDVAGRVGTAVGLGPQGFQRRGGALIGGTDLKRLM